MIRQFCLAMVLLTAAYSQVVPKRGGVRAAATPHNTVLTWAWSQGTGDPALGFHVWKSSTSGVYGTTPLAATSVNVLTYTDFAVVAGQTNYYVVTSYNGGGDSTNSNEATAVTPFQKPSAPTSLTAVPN
jgi:fibronectin type 3 domain-containing protein